MKIAILDDTKTHLQLMEQALVGGDVEQVWGESVNCELFDSGVALLDSLKKGHVYDCLLLDRQLPDMSGDVILAWLRQHSSVYMPVLLVSNLRLEESIVDGLEMGADDYICKPFRSGELLARVRRVVNNNRRSNALMAGQIEVQHANMQVSVIAGYEFDPVTQSVKFNEQTVEMTDREFRLAQILFANINGLLSRDDLFKAAWRRADVNGGRALDTHIYRVRSKLNLTPENGFNLRAVYGYGYRLEHVEFKTWETIKQKNAVAQL
ncbi:MAG: response regulator transcription factor [Formosimonas sp.]